ncbi:hypothetical protein [Oceanirhabdus seepicola]|uniref:Uncharacterized protein n=1 Tax=Oceanirhabdus seepicola TaxID=2828781 RepID=A0A9J6P208_9CLOT|nr:hypothetical protein [Oceanirhabdus seepicola]MCM1990081.1 hypothetical protein [Oceanirhabdus seepicola]
MNRFVAILMIIVIESNLIFCEPKFDAFQENISGITLGEYERGIEIKFKFHDFHRVEKYFYSLEKKENDNKEVKYRKIDNKSFINIESLDLKIYIVLDSENKQGKIKIISSDKVMIEELLEKIDSEKFLFIKSVTTNIKYKLNDELESGYATIKEYYNSTRYEIDDIDFARGKEIIIYHKFFILPLKKRKISHIILIEYGREHFMIVGDKEIFMDY